MKIIKRNGEFLPASAKIRHLSCLDRLIERFLIHLQRFKKLHFEAYQSAFRIRKNINGPWIYKGILNEIAGNSNTNHQAIIPSSEKTKIVNDNLHQYERIKEFKPDFVPLSFSVFWFYKLVSEYNYIICNEFCLAISGFAKTFASSSESIPSVLVFVSV